MGNRWARYSEGTRREIGVQEREGENPDSFRSFRVEYFHNAYQPDTRPFGVRLDLPAVGEQMGRTDRAPLLILELDLDFLQSRAE